MGSNAPLALDALGLDWHPAVSRWFERRFPEGPTEPQAAGWPEIARGRDTLIAAPTGSGKTLAAFLVCIDRLLRDAAAGRLEERVDVVYVSPLKALAADIHQNLEVPLAEIGAEAMDTGDLLPPVRALLRTGDTPASARAAMLKKPPHILVTTPESLFLLVTAERSRELLRGVRTVIVDEIHAVAGNKRGSHLALTLERLEQLCDARPARVGLSATQRPIEIVSDLLVGKGGDEGCAIVDLGHRRHLDLAMEIPGSELEAVASHEQWGEILDRVAALVEDHHTTLVFVNTRRMAERLAHLLEERLGSEGVASHHGSLSKERRLRVEDQLRKGELRALVATASLELGIDIGPVELVCQIGSPRSLATFLQRVGRSGHARGQTPKGRLFPTTRDELVECTAILHGVQEGRLDALRPPAAPLDILAQQIVAACAADEWPEDDLFALVRGAAPYKKLAREDFDAVLDLLSDGITTGRGRRAAWIHRDRVNAVLRGRRGARLAALTSGGAIPETADYRVVADPDDTFIGTVNEDWAIESSAGDIFLLGSTSWQIRRVESGVVRVKDAGGAPPTVPFWLGEAPARTEELSEEVSALRVRVGEKLEEGGLEAAERWLTDVIGLPPGAAQQLARYVEAGRRALGVVPSQQDVVFERFFDETGGMQLVVHAPYGGRINRGLGLALRKKFCRTFDFELQAAANDDAVVLSLGPQHSFPLEQVPRFLSAATVRDALSQAILASPMFQARWRWSLGFALAVLRRRGGKKNPPPIQRMEADDLMAAVFPAFAACQDNAPPGPIEIPDHPLVRQTIHDCLTDATDAEGLEQVLAAMEGGTVRVHLKDTTEPSPLCHEILNGRPFTFLDDAPLEERRTRAVTLRRGLPVEERDLARLDPDAVARVREEAAPDPRDADELHDALLGLVVARPREEWRGVFEELVAAGRAAVAETTTGPLWWVAESRCALEALYPDARLVPELPLPASLVDREAPDADGAAADAVRGHLDASGPLSAGDLAARTGLAESTVEIALARLEAEGFALRGRFDPGRRDDAEEFCARRLLARIHAYTQERLRREIEPVTAQDFMRFLLRWHHTTRDTRLEGRRGVAAAVEQLQGFELAAGSWEEAVLPARIAGYRPEWLDSLCLSGEVAWGRLSPRAPAPDAPARGSASPSRSTPFTLAVREDLDWLLVAARGETAPVEPGPGAAADVLACLRRRGALFYRELVADLARLPVEVEEGLWDLVARGLVTADGFQSVRALLGARQRWARSRTESARGRARRRDRRRRAGSVGAEGRWAVLPQPPPDDDPEALAEAVAEQLLVRWGVVFRDLLVRESLAVPWREVLWALRRMEARGTARGGRFVTGFVGEQYALPEAVDALRRTRRRPRDGEVVRLSAVDPLNLVGIVVPGERVAALRTNEVVFRDGLAVGEDAA